MRVLGIIPSRYQSSRFPGKPLAKILGKSMIQRVYEQCKKCSLLDDLIIATDDNRIITHVQNFGGKAMMTSKDHLSGTERCNEVLQKIGNNYDKIINIQGDEPCINPKQIIEVINLLNNSKIEIATLARKITDPDLIYDINTPKAVFDKNGIALNFCRKILDFSVKENYYEHIGIYGYQSNTLAEICKLPYSKNEQKESLEQLRWLDNNYIIQIGITRFKSFSIDIPQDIIEIEARMR